MKGPSFGGSTVAKSFWSVAVGEVGNFVFSVNFETFSAYGAGVDKLNADPAFQAWQVKGIEIGNDLMGKGQYGDRNCNRTISCMVRRGRAKSPAFSIPHAIPCQV
jgi:hypothetical protein